MPDLPKCAGKTRAGEPCRNYPLQDSRFCKLHGGRAPKGIANHAFKHGRYSRYMTKRYAGLDWNAITEDAEVLELRSLIVLTDGRINEILKVLDEGPQVEDWAALQDAFAQFLTANQAADTAAMVVHLETMRGILGRPVPDVVGAWKEIRETAETRRKLSDSERKRVMDMSALVTGEQLLGLMTFIQNILFKHIRDKSVLTAIAEDIRATVQGSGLVKMAEQEGDILS